MKPIFRCEGTGLRPTAIMVKRDGVFKDVPYDPMSKRYQCPECGRWIKLRKTSRELAPHNRILVR